MSHAQLGGQASNQATVSGPGRCRPPTSRNRQFSSMTPCGSVTNRVMFSVAGRPASYLASGSQTCQEQLEMYRDSTLFFAEICNT